MSLRVDMLHVSIVGVKVYSTYFQNFLLRYRVITQACCRTYATLRISCLMYSHLPTNTPLSRFLKLASVPPYKINVLEREAR